MKTQSEKRDLLKQPGQFRRKQLSTAVALGALMMSTNVAAQPELEEVVVTATRRAQAVQDVPYSISVLNGQTIDDTGVKDLNDMINLIPGLVSAEMGADAGVNNTLIMRGVNANNPGTNNILPNVVEPSVSTYLNNSPVFLNLKLADISRVEVLRGPQGTLYGSGSVGGTVRFIFNEPDTEKASSSLSAGVTSSAHSDDLGYEVDFVGNLPLAENMALRVSAGYELSSGVTDATALSVLDGSGGVVPVGGDMISGAQSQTSMEDTDESDVVYVRASMLWAAAEDTDVLLSVFHQENSADSDTYMRLTDGQNRGEEWENGRRFLTPGDFEADVISLEVESDLGFATFSSSTSTTETTISASNDISNLYEAIDEATGGIAYFGSPRLAFLTEADAEYEAVTQEFRLASNGDGDWDWVLGLYYHDSDSDLEVHDVDYSYEDWLASVPDIYYGLGTFLDVLNTFSYRTPPYTGAYYQDRQLSFEDKAIFGEFSYHFTDLFQATIGFRKFWQEFDSSQVVALPYCGSYCSMDGNLNGATAAQNGAKFDDQLFKFNASYDVNDNTMVYFTWSEGFRHGGANSFPTAGFAGVDPSFVTFDPDEATNLEIGVKGSVGSNTRYSFALYQINWDQIQLDVYAGALGIPGVINGEEATSQGFEFEIFSQLSDQLSLDFGIGYTSAEISEDAGLLNFSDAIIAADGDPLPGVPEVQLSVNLNYYQPLAQGAELHYNLNGSYRSSAYTNFNENFGNYTELDGFGKWNASVTWDNDTVAITAFVRNITDEAGLTGVQNGRGAYSHIGFIGRPRSIGLRVSYDFD